MKKLVPKTHKVAEFSDLWFEIESNLDDWLDVYIDNFGFLSRQAAWEYFGSYADLLSWHPFEVIESEIKNRKLIIH